MQSISCKCTVSQGSDSLSRHAQDIHAPSVVSACCKLSLLGSMKLSRLSPTGHLSCLQKANFRTNKGYKDDKNIQTTSSKWTEAGCIGRRDYKRVVWNMSYL